jgi:hypothetical protein
VRLRPGLCLVLLRCNGCLCQFTSLAHLLGHLGRKSGNALLPRRFRFVVRVSMVTQCSRCLVPNVVVTIIAAVINDRRFTTIVMHGTIFFNVCGGWLHWQIFGQGLLPAVNIIILHYIMQLSCTTVSL